MMNSELINSLQERRSYLLNAVTSAQNMLSANCPKGRLRCKTQNGKQEYYCITERGDSTGRYIRKEEIELAVLLAQKQYNESIVSKGLTELRRIDLLLCSEREGNVDDIYGKLNPIRKKLVTPIRLTDEQYLERWLNVPYEGKKFHENSPEFYSSGGVRVRSKSEIIITDTLERMNIPYRYEFPYKFLGHGVFYPDFTILNLRLRKELIWEHFGMMDDAEYCENALNKIDIYEQNGFVPGQTLIITFETKNRPLTPGMIRRKIKEYLL